MILNLSWSTLVGHIQSKSKREYCPFQLYWAFIFCYSFWLSSLGHWTQCEKFNPATIWFLSISGIQMAIPIMVPFCKKLIAWIEGTKGSISCTICQICALYAQQFDSFFGWKNWPSPNWKVYLSQKLQWKVGPKAKELGTTHKKLTPGLIS